MIRDRASLAMALVVCAAGAAVACNKGPARVALAETEEALVAARPELEQHAPAELATIVADADLARQRLEAGEYTNALRLAQRLPERIARAVARARALRSRPTKAGHRLEPPAPPLESPPPPPESSAPPLPAGAVPPAEPRATLAPESASPDTSPSEAAPEAAPATAPEMAPEATPPAVPPATGPPETEAGTTPETEAGTTPEKTAPPESE